MEASAMDNIGVVYATKTQHSRKLAEAIAQELGVTAKNITENTQPEETRLLFIVGGIYGGKCNPDLLAYAEKLDPSLVKKAAIVTSSVSVSNRSQKELRELLTKKGVDVVGEISCAGSFLFVKLTHPNKADIDAITHAAKELAASTFS